jgi:hypothetical protein
MWEKRNAYRIQVRKTEGKIIIVHILKNGKAASGMIWLRKGTNVRLL